MRPQQPQCQTVAAMRVVQMQETLEYKIILLEKPLYFGMDTLVAFLLSYIIWYFVHRFRRRQATRILRGAEAVQRRVARGPGGFVTLMAAALIGFFCYKFYTGFIAVEIRPDRILL